MADIEKYAAELQDTFLASPEAKSLIADRHIGKISEEQFQADIDLAFAVHFAKSDKPSL